VEEAPLVLLEEPFAFLGLPPLEEAATAVVAATAAAGSGADALDDLGGIATSAVSAVVLLWYPSLEFGGI